MGFLRQLAHILILCNTSLCAQDLKSVSEFADVGRIVGNSANYSMTATVVHVNSTAPHSVFITDRTGFMSLEPTRDLCTSNLVAGDRVFLSGRITYRNNGRLDPVICHLKHLGHEDPPPVCDASIADALSGRFDFRPIRLTATVQDVFTDETDPDYLFMILEKDGVTISAAIHSACQDLEPDLIGAFVSITGICDAYIQDLRKYKGRTINLESKQDITVLHPATATAFKFPDISALTDIPAHQMHARGRHSAQGVVIVSWRNSSFLLKTGSGDFVRIETATPVLPAIGNHILAVGFPETDFYTINLTHARWREVDWKDKNCPTRQSDSEILRDPFLPENNREFVNPSFHGRLVCQQGIVRNIPDDANDNYLLLDCGKRLIQVDTSALSRQPDAALLGCRISIAGISIMKTDSYRPNAAFPHIRGYTIVMRPDDDITILEKPSWWTPLRIWTAFGVVIAGLIAFFIWNVTLRRLVERRGRQLLRNEVERAKAELKTVERTRIAVELHDSLSQALTGISMQIDAAGRLLGKGNAPSLRHLALASRSLVSCRKDLRNCIWDLRNQPLDEKGMNEAINRAVLPHVGTTQLQIRFNVSRSRLPDNLAHAVICIVRELATNAVRHGKAKTIRIAGLVDDNVLHFSLSDDGCGFDPLTRPGIADGHFGLQGIAERLRSFSGTMKTESSPGHGARIAVSIPLSERTASHE